MRQVIGQVAVPDKCFAVYPHHASSGVDAVYWCGLLLACSYTYHQRHVKTPKAVNSCGHSHCVFCYGSLTCGVRHDLTHAQTPSVSEHVFTSHTRSPPAVWPIAACVPAEPSNGHVSQPFAPYVGSSPPPTHPTLHKLASHTKGSNGLITAASAEDDSRYLMHPI